MNELEKLRGRRKELLSELGDQNAVFVLPGAQGNPPALAFIIELNNGETLPIALKSLAGALAMAKQGEAEEQGIEPAVLLETTAYKGANLTTLILRQEKLKGKLNPTLFTQDQFLVLTTTPEAARALIDAYTTQTAEKAPKNSATASRIHLNIKAVSTAIDQYMDFLIAQGIKEGKSAEKARADLMSLKFLLSFISSIDIRGTYTPGRIDREAVIRY